MLVEGNWLWFKVLIILYSLFGKKIVRLGLIDLEWVFESMWGKMSFLIFVVKVV